MTDPISDMLTRVRNASVIKRESVDVSSSKVKSAILKILKEEGYIKDFKEITTGSDKASIRIYLKYGPLKQQIINNIRRVSKSSRRIYKKSEEIGKIFGGIGTAIYSTSRGIISDRECRKLKIGGELICIVS
ncbi:MAG TPA: 30S ribosomal protein S8 [Candidatus Wunengus sp. YC60]|uniref:30S ribosomal protein S8 n=1 Tax=Candidatus Wunengus sp. YC60 TaxID=3367697 RepID=UPI0040253E69